MRYLSLFSGAGFGDLAHQRLFGHQCVGYVEWDEYAASVLKQRQADGWLDRAPVFQDVRSFAVEYAGRYRGVADCVSAGFPCQPFSVAGKRSANADERNMWPATIEVIRQVRPRVAHLENVPGLLSAVGADGRRYFGTILEDLAEAGFDARWGVYGADDVGAPHRRKRLWIVADRAGSRLP